MNEAKILVVGGAGYIGSHMVKALLDADYGVVTLDDLSRGHKELLPGGEFVKGGIHDGQLLDRVFTRYRIDAVMHFAAWSLVGESVKNPLSYYHNNVSGTENLLAAMVRHNIGRFIFSSTAAVFGEPGEVPITEDHPCSPTNPYGATKLCVERMLKDCDAGHGLRHVILRYFNAAGADDSGTLGERHDPETHLIPLVLDAALHKGKKAKIFGTRYPTPDGTCIRDYVHVNDLARAHLLALEALLTGKESAVYNLGNSKGYSVREVIRCARKITGKPIPAVESEPRPGDPAVLVASSEKIKEELGWKPRYEDLETIVETAWKWHRREG